MTDARSLGEANARAWIAGNPRYRTVQRQPWHQLQEVKQQRDLAVSMLPPLQRAAYRLQADRIAEEWRGTRPRVTEAVVSN